MVVSPSDIDLLRLAAWCKNLPSDISKRFAAEMFCPDEMEFKEKKGLIGRAKNGKSFRLWELGWQLLRYFGYDYHRDAGYRADDGRRLEVANILLTFYRAGYNVFAEKADDLAASQVFLQSPAARRDASAGDLWGGAVFHGMASIGELVAVCYYIAGYEDTQINRRNERMLLDKASAMLRRRPAQIFAGPDYLRLARMLRNPAPKADKATESKWTFAEMYRNAPCPLYLLECSDIGARQLMIMSQQDYRRRLVIALAGEDAGPPAGIRDADGQVFLTGEQYPMPAALAVDMDVKRLDRAFRQSMDSGHAKLGIFCLAEQKKALEYLYAGGGKAQVLILPPKAVAAAFGELFPHEPAPAAYIDREGGSYNATDLPVSRKVGKKTGGKARAAQDKDKR